MLSTLATYESLLTTMPSWLAGLRSAEPNACREMGGVLKRFGELRTVSFTHLRTAGDGAVPATVIELSRQSRRKKNRTPSRYFAGAGGLSAAAMNSSGEGHASGLYGSTRVRGTMNVEIIALRSSCPAC